MKICFSRMIFVFGCFALLLTAGCEGAVIDDSYDYSASIECLADPLPPQYGGGVITNPMFNLGSENWTVVGNGQIEARTSKSGNKYLVAYNRRHPSDSFGRVFPLQNDTLYTFSAWIQIDKGKEIVSAVLRIPSAETTIVGSVIAAAGCWSMLKGGFKVDLDTNATLYFQSENTEIELWLDNVSLKPFSREQWRNQQLQSIEKLRKKSVKIHVMDKNGQNIQGAKVILKETKPRFLIGGGSTAAILDNKEYQDWFTSRFTATTFDNEMKWYYTERQRGNENYTVPDAMVTFFRNYNISIRGHNILWDNPAVIQPWVKNLSSSEILKAAVQRTRSVVSRYAGKVIAWDVVNENLHFHFLEDQIGLNASAMFFNLARGLDREAPLFLNEFNTLAMPQDLSVIPFKHVEKIREIISYPGNTNMMVKIGLQGHFSSRPKVSYIRACLDVLGATKIPIWLTELDTKRGPNQAAELEEVMREAFAHPGVEGIIVWGGWNPTSCNQTCLDDKNFNVKPKGCAEMCLVDSNFKNLPPGDVVDKLIEEWRTLNVEGVTDSKGVFESRLFQGSYSVTVSDEGVSSSLKKDVIIEGPGSLEVSITL